MSEFVASRLARQLADFTGCTIDEALLTLAGLLIIAHGEDEAADEHRAGTLSEVEYLIRIRAAARAHDEARS